MMQLSKVTRMVSIDVPTFRYRWHSSNTVKGAQRMADYFQANVKAEEEVLCEAGDWRHLLQYVKVFGKVTDDRRQGFFTRKITLVTRYARIRIRRRLGFVRVKREVA